MNIKFSAISCLVFSCCLFNPVSGRADTALWEVFAEDRSMALDPFAVLDTMLQAQNEMGVLTVESLISFHAMLESEDEAEDREVFASIDVDGDGSLAADELGDWSTEFFNELDQDGNGVLEFSEARGIDSEDHLLLTPEEVNAQVAEDFLEFDEDKDGLIDLVKEVDSTQKDGARELDGNRDGALSRKEMFAFVLADNTPIRFEVEGDVAYMTGVITSRLPAKVLRLLFEHPAVKVIEMKIVPGSIDDDANLRAATYVFQHGLTTRLTATSSIASGGTDFFVGGRSRIIEEGATIGVHSWSPGGDLDGSDIPRDDPQHKMYIDFYESVGIPGEFYWFTMDAAPPDRIHLMTREEIGQYGLRTEGKF